jgi:hypothetical protein
MSLGSSNNAILVNNCKSLKNVIGEEDWGRV